MAARSATSDSTTNTGPAGHAAVRAQLFKSCRSRAPRRVGDPLPFVVYVAGDSVLPVGQGQKGNSDARAFGPRRSA